MAAAFALQLACTCDSTEPAYSNFSVLVTQYVMIISAPDRTPQVQNLMLVSDVVSAASPFILPICGVQYHPNYQALAELIVNVTNPLTSAVCRLGTSILLNNHNNNTSP